MRPPVPADENDPTTSAFTPSALHGRLVHGTCGWASKSQVLSVYTKEDASSGEKRLPVYSERFGCVEVDSTTYAIPSSEVVRRWVEKTPEGFVFLVKAFGGLCAPSVDARQLPADVRALARPNPSGRVHFATLPERAKDALWERFNACLAPMAEAGKLGCVVFQFHLSQGVSDALRAHILECQRRLNGAKMAVEFRNRDWITGERGDDTARWCREHDLLLVAADELEHETFQRDREQSGLPPGAVRRRMPTRLERTVDWGALIRVHRRHGTTERVLDADDINFWASLLNSGTFERPALGPVWVAWGTEWLDAPLTNAAALDKAAGESWTYDWFGTRALRARPKPPPRPSAIAALFAAAKPRERADDARPSPASTPSAKSTSPLLACWARADARSTD